MTFSVTVLGNSSALPTSKRFPSACVLNVHERFFLIDCGEGTQIQLRRCKIKLGKINHIFISHLHGDHIFGLFGLISTFNLIGRKSDLHIYANKNIEVILNNHFKFFDKNREYNIVYHFLKEGKDELIYEDKNLIIKAFPLKHRIPTHGFLFNEKKRPNHIRKELINKYNIPIKKINDIKYGEDFVTEEGEIIRNNILTTPSYIPRSFAFCSDTLYNENIVSIIKNVDLLWHEATFLNNLKNRAEETYHSTAEDAANIAKFAEVKNLLLSHFSSRYKDLDVIKSEAATVFKNIYIAEEGMEFGINIEGPLKIKNLFDH